MSIGYMSFKRHPQRLSVALMATIAMPSRIQEAMVGSGSLKKGATRLPRKCIPHGGSFARGLRLCGWNRFWVSESLMKMMKIIILYISNLFKGMFEWNLKRSIKHAKSRSFGGKWFQPAKLCFFFLTKKFFPLRVCSTTRRLRETYSWVSFAQPPYFITQLWYYIWIQKIDWIDWIVWIIISNPCWPSKYSLILHSCATHFSTRHAHTLCMASLEIWRFAHTARWAKVDLFVDASIFNNFVYFLYTVHLSDQHVELPYFVPTTTLDNIAS